MLRRDNLGRPHGDRPVRRLETIEGITSKRHP
jgi:hypothetical protein